MYEENQGNTALVQQLAGPLAQAKIWMQIVGVLLIIYGVLTAITIVGIIFAWLPIWMGVLLFQAAGAAGQAQSGGDPAVLERALGKIKVYFIIMGVLTLIGLVLMGLAFVMGGVGAMMGMSQMG